MASDHSRTIKILVLYSLPCQTERKTVFDHLYSFERYVDDAQFHYCNVLTHLPHYLKLVQYDGIIFHYTYAAMRWWQPFVWRRLLRVSKALKKSRAFKVAIPQDEYAHTNDLCTLFREFKVDAVFTCAHPIDYQTLYPREQSGLRHYITTYPGFVDEETEASIRKRVAATTQERAIDIGYRARDLPHWLGRFGQYKGNLGRALLRWKDKTTLKMDVSIDYKDVFYGDDWIHFLLSCRTAAGCLGGASIHDPDGTIRERTEAYQAAHPRATFEESQQACFPDRDDSLHLFTLSPRHFECAMTKTCQLLVEGDYHGIMEAGKHYIEIKKDFSNLEEVFQMVKDDTVCSRIAEQAYQDLIASGNYTYRRFAQQVVDLIRSEQVPEKRTFWFDIVGWLLRQRSKCVWGQRQHFRIRNYLMRGYFFFLRRSDEMIKYFKEKEKIEGA